MDRRVTLPTWGPPPPCKQALNRNESVHAFAVFFFLTYCVKYVWKSSLWIGINFKELHNDQEHCWPPIYKAGAAVVSTITSY